MTLFGKKIVAAIVLIAISPLIYFALQSIKRSIQGQPILAFFIIVFVAPPLAAGAIVLIFAVVGFIID